jgi:tight adherence protein B
VVRRLAGVVGLALLLCAAGASSASADARIRGHEEVAYPLVRFTISTDDPAVLTPQNIRVTENGVPAEITGVRALTSSTRNVQVVLAVDVSNSMRGRELQMALDAANEFVTHVPDWISVGVVSFASDPLVVSPITDDRAAVTATVSAMSATTSAGTALFGAVEAASHMFAPGGQHNVIVLTDGKNTGEATLDDAVAAAHEAHATVFTIGIAGGLPDDVVLRALALRTGGTYRLQTAEDLDAAYRSLALQLSQQYLIEYRAKTPYGAETHLLVSVPGGTDEARFRMPPLPGPLPDAHTGFLDRLLAGDIGTVVVVLLVFIAAAMFMNLVTTMYRGSRRAQELRRRFLAPGSSADEADGEASHLVPHQLADAVERGADAAGAGRGIARVLQRAGWKVGVGEFLVPTIFGPIIVGLLLGVAVHPVAGVVVTLLGWVVPFVVLFRAARKRLLALQGQLSDVLMILASSLRAGHSFLQALDSVAKEIDEPAASEFGRALSEIQLGRSIDDALQALSERVGSLDLEWAVTAINIQRKSGGNLAEVLETVAATIREREALRRQVRALSAEGRWSAVILIVLPFLILGYMLVVSPGYLAPLLEWSFGKLVLAAGGVLMLVGWVWMRKIVRLDV